MVDEKLKKLVENYAKLYNKLSLIISTYKKLSDTDKAKVRFKFETYRYINVKMILNEDKLKERVSKYNLDKILLKQEPDAGKDLDINAISNGISMFLELEQVVKEINEYINTIETDSKDEIESNDFLDYTLTGDHKKEIFNTSILDNYRNWGIERIALDGFQNHLKEDSKGTSSFLQFLIDDKWVDYEDALLQKNKITKVRFADNGVGFDKNNLRFLSSQKTSEDLSVGQFGEGLKLIAMASVNLGLGLEVQSQNWKAKAIGKPIEYSNYRNKELGKTTEKRIQLAWEISEYDAEPMQRVKNNISYSYTRVY